MKKLLKRALPLLLSMAILIASVPFVGMVSAISAKTITEDFNDLTKWEDIVGNHMQSTAPVLRAASSIQTIDEKSALLPVQAGSTRSSYVTVVKDEYWPSDRRLESFSTTFFVEKSSSIDNDTAIYLYKPMDAVNGVEIGNYWGLAIQMSATSSSTLQWRWQQFVWDSTNSKVTHSCGSNVNTGLAVTNWITANVSYDYSAISENKVTFSVTFSDGTTTTTKQSKTVTFDAVPDTFDGLTDADIKAMNLYQEGFKAGISSTGTGGGARQSSYYFDNFNAQFSETEADKVAEFETKYDEVLSLASITTNAQANTLFEAINEYNSLSDEAKALMTETIAKLNTLKATFKLTSDDFENSLLLGNVWESLPETGDIQTLGQLLADEADRVEGVEYKGNATTQSAAQEIIADSKDETNNVLKPEYRSSTRKRKILTVKEAYLKNADITSFSTNVRIDAECGNIDRSPGIYFYYGDADNWGRIELQNVDSAVKVRIVIGKDASLSTGANNIFHNNTTLTGVTVGEWFNVKVDYEYTETGTNLTFTFTGDTDTTVKTVTTTDFNSVKKVGYGAGGNTIDLMYFDNFAITYAATADDFKTEHSEALALTTDTVTIADKDIVLGAIEAYNSTSAVIQNELADEYALLASLKVKIANLEAKSGLLTEDFEKGFDNWEIVNDEGEDGGVVANPVKDSVNSSNKALAADGTNRATTDDSLANNFTIYKLKDSIVEGTDNIASVSGKLYIKASNYTLTFITEYTDSNNYAGMMISIEAITNSFDTKYSMSARAIRYIDGVGTQYANASDAVYLINENYDGTNYGWYYFTLDYTDTGYRLRITDENGVSKNDAYFELPIDHLYANATADTKDTVFTGENTIFAVSARSSSGNGIPYFDDLEIAFANSDYSAAAEFLKDYTSVLCKNTNSIAPADSAEITAMANAYNTLSDKVKAILDIADVVNALEAANWSGDAAEEYTSRYSAVINSEINADNVADFEQAWNILNRLDAATQAQLKALRATLVSKLTSYSGTLNLTDKIRVTVIGDSITYGYGITGTSTNAWPAKLQTALGDAYDIKNFAISGYKVVNDYASGGVQYLTDTYRNIRKIGMQQDTDIVIIALGVNDSSHLSANTTARYDMLVKGYKDLINYFLENSTCSTVIVSGAMWDTDGKGDDYSPEVNKAAKEACDTTGATYVDLYSYVEEKFNVDEESLATYLQSDMLHYTEAGEQVVADFFYDYFTAKQETIFRTANASYFDNYFQNVTGASIKKSNEEGQDIRFSATFGRIRSGKTVKSYGMIITLKNYITKGYVNISDMTVANAVDNEYLKIAYSTDISDVAEGNTFYANVGGVSQDMYGYQYTMRIFVEYTDGTVDYSDTMNRSVIGVAKSILTWVYNNYEAIDDEYGVGDYTTLFTAINSNGKFTWVAGATDNNGEAILNYLSDNSAEITNALNAKS